MSSTHNDNTPPIPNSYWATPFLCASEYPFCPTHSVPQVDKLLKAGIRTFIDLTEPGELLPYENLLRVRARVVGIPDDEPIYYHRFPIRDRCIPPKDSPLMKEIMAVLEVRCGASSFVWRALISSHFSFISQECELAERKAVVHCRGGIGRTGTVVRSLHSTRLIFSSPNSLPSLSGRLLVRPIPPRPGRRRRPPSHKSPVATCRQMQTLPRQPRNRPTMRVRPPFRGRHVEAGNRAAEFLVKADPGE